MGLQMVQKSVTFSDLNSVMVRILCFYTEFGSFGGQLGKSG